jgi:hypothetical protein
LRKVPANKTVLGKSARLLAALSHPVVTHPVKQRVQQETVSDYTHRD